MKVRGNDDPQLGAIETGLLSLQADRATGRCLQALVRRRDELSSHGRGVLDIYLKVVKVPGFRPGKAPPERVLPVVAKNPQFERDMFRRCFRFWMELNAGLPERVVDVGRKAAPGIDFAADEWSQIAEAATSIATRMPQHPREDILLALFASRWGSYLEEPCVCEACAIAKENGESQEPEENASAPSSYYELDLSVSQAAADGAINTSSLDPAAAAALASLRSILSELTLVDARSSLWDAALDEVLGSLATLRGTKLVERRTLDVRTDLAAALVRLQEQSVIDELVFLKLRDACAGWNIITLHDDDVPFTLPPLVGALVSELEAHREARLAAHQAEDDEQLEAHTATRIAAKTAILAMMSQLGPFFQTPAPAETVAHGDRIATDSRPASIASGLAEVDAASVRISTSEPEAPMSAPVDLPPTELPALEPPGPTIDVSDAASLSTVPDRHARPLEPTRRDAEVMPPLPEVMHPLPTGAPDAAEPVSTMSPTSEQVTIQRSAQSSAAKNDSAAEETPAESGTTSKSRTSTADLAVAALFELPTELSSYERFREHFWTGADQVVEIAPWKDPAFPEHVELAARSALGSGPARTWELLILCQALETLGCPPPMATVDIRASASLWTSPDSPTAGLDPDRSDRLRSGRAAMGSAHQRIALVLEAVRPSLERQLLPHEINAFVDLAGFQSGALRVVTQRLLTATAQGHDVIQLLRRLPRAPSTQGDVASRLDAARKELQALVTRVWNAAGGKIQRTHCRHAWSDFIEQIQPQLARLFPPPRGDDLWSIPEIAGQVDTFTGRLEETCERYGAKFDDKRRMLRTAGELADAARNVLDLRREQLSADDGRRPMFALPELELDHLRVHQLAQEDEEFARQILIRATNPAATAEELHPLAITIEEICRRPDLLRVLRDVPPESIEALHRSDGAIAYADDLFDPIRAAAIVLQTPEDASALTLESLVNRLERSQRGALLGLLVKVLDERLQRRIHEERSDSLGRLVAAVSRVSQVVDDLAHLGNRFASSMRGVRDRARQIVETDDVRLDTRLIEAWLDRVIEMGRSLVEQHVEQLSLQAAKREDADAIQEALKRANYGRAIRLLQGHSGADIRGTRQTEWRDAVEPNRDALLLKAFALTDPKVKSMLDAWRVGVRGDPVRADRTLRTEFVKMITDGRSMDRDSQPSFVAIPMASIQAELAHAQLMPTFMPQLSRFGRLTVLTPPVSPEQSSFKQATLSKLGEFHRDLVLLLTPRLPGGRRTEILSDLRQRRIAAAVIDDVDLIRLLNPGGQRPHQMLGTLEIAFEQQRRGMFSPFELPEGSHVRLEMYVGRQDKARELARTANYSRLFSGRKLGKSALLRFMESSEGGVRLPSGNALRVVYVPAVGIESEAVMIEAIVTSLEAAAAVRLERPRDGEPADKLGAILSGYLAAHRAESLLLVLDEADVFFERQLAEYEERRERCLSFQMRSRFSAMTDEHGLPRIRFLFAGYRVTNRSQGAWSNWGRVLSLDPLEPEDAARLVAGPLAMMGIDVAAHAHEIAYRCGYQPAILLRFGERLVDHLDRQSHRGEHYVVSPADIAHVLEDPRVHEEIRTIARNNFEGNPVGLIVFSAFLRELLELPPGQPLRDAPQRIVERLRKIDTDLAWLERDGDGSATVRAYLADFVERSLLRERRVEGEYSLRFPHHLPILASLADAVRIRDELRRVRSRAEGTADSVELAVVAPRILRDLTEAAQENSNAIGIVGTLWPTATYDRSGGIADRLGATPDETVDAHVVLEGQRSFNGIRVVRRTDTATAELVIGETQSAVTRPTLVGGADLLRWGILRRRASSDLLFEVHGVGRLPMGRLTWWFQRVRGLEFARTDSLEQIHTRTGGIPILLEIVDGQLLSAAGTTVSDDRVKLALSALDDAIPIVARELVAGRPSSSLLAREREILEMIECVTRIDPSAGSDLAAALTELWELFADKCPISPLSSSDAVALEVLLELGFLPAMTMSSWEAPLTRLAPILPDDPLFAIVRAFSAERAID